MTVRPLTSVRCITDLPRSRFAIMMELFRCGIVPRPPSLCAPSTIYGGAPRHLPISTQTACQLQHGCPPLTAHQFLHHVGSQRRADFPQQASCQAAASVPADRTSTAHAYARVLDTNGGGVLSRDRPPQVLRDPGQPRVFPREGSRPRRGGRPVGGSPDAYITDS